MDDDKGTGLVLVNTEKGHAALDWSKTNHKETTADIAIGHNLAYFRSVAAHPKRAEFFARIDETESVNTLIVDCLRPALKQRLRMSLSSCKQLIKKILIFAMGGGKTKIATRPEIVSIPPMPETASVASITFRNKHRGWKSYCMEIKIESESREP